MIPKIKKVSNYDWIKIKQEFLISEYIEVYTFLREKYELDPNSNGAVARQVRGWSDEKQELKRQWLEDAKKQIANLYIPTAEELAKMHQGVIILVKAILEKEKAECLQFDPITGQQIVIRMPNIATIERVWRIIKAEKLEPVAVSKNENALTKEEQDLIDELLDQNFNED